MSVVFIGTEEPLAVAAVAAIRTGDLATLQRLLEQKATAALLVAAGADVNARFAGPHTETVLHWAASSDDVEVVDALLDAGADIEAPGAVIGLQAPRGARGRRVGVHSRRGREKLHYLNPVPIQEIHERWISKYEHSRLRALTALRTALEQPDD